MGIQLRPLLVEASTSAAGAVTPPGSAASTSMPLTMAGNPGVTRATSSSPIPAPPDAVTGNSSTSALPIPPAAAAMSKFSFTSVPLRRISILRVPAAKLGSTKWSRRV